MTRSERMKAHWADPEFRAKVKASRSADKPKRNKGEVQQEKEEKKARRELIQREKEEKRLARQKKKEIRQRIEEKNEPLIIKEKELENFLDTEDDVQKMAKEIEEFKKAENKKELEKVVELSSPSLSSIMHPCVDCKILWLPRDLDPITGLCPLCKGDI